MKRVQKARELLNANITHVSYVDKGANQKKFFLTKSEDAPVFEKQVKIITKADDEQKLVYGVVYEPDVKDSHGDFMVMSEIEKAAHQFLKDARNVDTQHDFESGAGEVVESYVAPTDLLIGSETISKGSWVLVTKATDEIWESIQKGEITGYSMAGTAETIEKADEEEAEKASFFKAMKDFFTKGEIKDRFYESKQRREFRASFDYFEDVFFSELWKKDPDTTRIKDAALDFSELLEEIANSPDILKAIGPIEKEEVIKLRKEDLQALLKEELAPIIAKLEAVEGGEQGEAVTKGSEGDTTVKKADGEPSDTAPTQEELVKALKDTLAESLAPINERLEAVEKARGISNQLEADEVTKGEEEVDKDNIFKSLFQL